MHICFIVIYKEFVIKIFFSKQKQGFNVAKIPVASEHRVNNRVEHLLNLDSV